jgi:hypothetical protein
MSDRGARKWAITIILAALVIAAVLWAVVIHNQGR